jgi:hypothetical protein
MNNLLRPSRRLSTTFDHLHHLYINLTLCVAPTFQHPPQHTHTPTHPRTPQNRLKDARPRNLRRRQSHRPAQRDPGVSTLNHQPRSCRRVAYITNFKPCSRRDCRIPKISEQINSRWSVKVHDPAWARFHRTESVAQYSAMNATPSTTPKLKPDSKSVQPTAAQQAVKPRDARASAPRHVKFADPHMTAPRPLKFTDFIKPAASRAPKLPQPMTTGAEVDTEAALPSNKTSTMPTSSLSTNQVPMMSPEPYFSQYYKPQSSAPQDSAPDTSFAKYYKPQTEPPNPLDAAKSTAANKPAAEMAPIEIAQSSIDFLARAYPGLPLTNYKPSPNTAPTERAHHPGQGSSMREAPVARRKHAKQLDDESSDDETDQSDTASSTIIEPTPAPTRRPVPPGQSLLYPKPAPKRATTKQAEESEWEVVKEADGCGGGGASEWVEVKSYPGDPYGVPSAYNGKTRNMMLPTIVPGSATQVMGKLFSGN